MKWFSILLLLATPAQSQFITDFCAPRDEMVKELTKGKYKEVLVGAGTANKRKQIIELYVSLSGSFTVLVTLSNGMACLALAGTNWKAVTEGTPL